MRSVSYTHLDVYKRQACVLKDGLFLNPSVIIQLYPAAKFSPRPVLRCLPIEERNMTLVSNEMDKRLFGPLTQFGRILRLDLL